MINKILAVISRKHISRELKHILITDSQSVRSSNMLKVKAKGRDSHKKVKGLKQFVLCDSTDICHYMFTTPANTS
jgi:hypothetical protein